VQTTDHYVYVDPLPDFAPSYAGSLVSDATKAWSDANPNIKFWTAPSEQQADLYIQWIRDYGTNPVGETISGQVIQIGLGDSHCGGKWQPFSSKTLYHIALHELGHFLGFEHSNDPNSIMYPSVNIEYGTVTIEQNLAPAYVWFVPICSTKQVTAYDYSVSINDPQYGVDIYFVPSQTESANTSSGNAFQYYAGDGCHAENYLSYADSCDGVGAGSGLLIMTDKQVTNDLTKVIVNLTERPSATETLQHTVSKVHQYRLLSETELAQQQANQAISNVQTQAEQEKAKAEARTAEANAAANAARGAANSLKEEMESLKAKTQADVLKSKIEGENKLKELSQAYEKKTFYRTQMDNLKDGIKNAENMLSGLKFESTDAQKKVQQAWEERGMAMSDMNKAEEDWKHGSQALNKTDASLATSYFENIGTNTVSAGDHVKTISSLIDNAQQIETDYKKHRFCFLFWCFNI